MRFPDFLFYIYIKTSYPHPVHLLLQRHRLYLRQLRRGAALAVCVHVGVRTGVAGLLLLFLLSLPGAPPVPPPPLAAPAAAAAPGVILLSLLPVLLFLARMFLFFFLFVPVPVPPVVVPVLLLLLLLGLLALLGLVAAVVGPGLEEIIARNAQVLPWLLSHIFCQLPLKVIWVALFTYLVSSSSFSSSLSPSPSSSLVASSASLRLSWRDKRESTVVTMSTYLHV